MSFLWNGPKAIAGFASGRVFLGVPKENAEKAKEILKKEKIEFRHDMVEKGWWMATFSRQNKDQVLLLLEHLGVNE